MSLFFHSTCLSHALNLNLNGPIPSYRQKLKLCKPFVWTSKQWNSEAIKDLHTCLETTDWVRSATDILGEFTEAVTSHISFCEDSYIPSRAMLSYNNAEPWFRSKLIQLRTQKEEAFSPHLDQVFLCVSKLVNRLMSEPQSGETTNQLSCRINHWQRHVVLKQLWGKTRPFFWKQYYEKQPL